MAQPRIPLSQDTHVHQLYPDASCHVIPQIRNIRSTPGLRNLPVNNKSDSNLHNTPTHTCEFGNSHACSAPAPHLTNTRTPHLMLDSQLTMIEKVKSVVRVGVWLMIVGVLGYCTPAMKLLTRTSCGICWQTAMVTAGDARKDLFKNLQKPERVLEAPPIADNIAVDTRNNALLYSLGRWPPA